MIISGEFRWFNFQFGGSYLLSNYTFFLFNDLRSIYFGDHKSLDRKTNIDARQLHPQYNSPRTAPSSANTFRRPSVRNRNRISRIRRPAHRWASVRWPPTCRSIHRHHTSTQTHRKRRIEQPTRQRASNEPKTSFSLHPTEMEEWCSITHYILQSNTAPISCLHMCNMICLFPRQSMC